MPPKPIADRVAEAISSGLWKERTAPTGRKYYVHTKTKKSVWNLAAEIEAQGEGDAAGGNAGGAAAVASSRELREERLEKARRRQLEESQLNASLAQLERQKIKLENEITMLQGPVEAEAASIEDLKKQLADHKQVVDTVAKEVTQRRRERLAELHAMQAKVEKMEQAKQNEAAHQEAIKKRHAQLVSETQELRADLLREQATAESLKQSARAAELKLGHSKEELTALQRQVDHKRDVLVKLEADVVAASKQKGEAEQRLLVTQSAVAELQQRVEKQKQQSYAGKQLAKKRDGTAAELDLLASLMATVEQRRQTLRHLKQKAELNEHVTTLQDSCIAVKHLIHDAKRDKDQLDRLANMLDQQAESGVQLLAEYKAQALDLKHELADTSRRIFSN